MPKPSPRPKLQTLPEFVKHIEDEVKEYSKLVDLEGQKKRLIDENAAVQEVIDRRYSEVHDLDGEIAKRQNTLGRAGEVAEAELKRYLEPIRREIRDAEGQASQLRHSNDKLVTERDAIIDDMERLNGEIQTRTQERTDFDAQFTATREESIGQLKVLTDRIDTAQNQLEALNHEITEMAEKKTKTQAMIEELHRQADRAKSDNADEQHQANDVLARIRTEAHETEQAIKVAKEADEQRQIDLKSAETSLGIKMKALQRDRTEFEADKRKHYASNRM